jgi:hypothetical protein
MVNYEESEKPLYDSRKHNKMKKLYKYLTRDTILQKCQINRTIFFDHGVQRDFHNNEILGAIFTLPASPIENKNA